MLIPSTGLRKKYPLGHKPQLSLLCLVIHGFFLLSSRHSSVESDKVARRIEFEYMCSELKVDPDEDHRYWEINSAIITNTFEGTLSQMSG
jgi:hypothetical protein